MPSTHARPVGVTPPARSPLYIAHRSWSVPPGSLENLVGQVVRADNAVVVAVVAHNGFWVASSSPAARVYVQLVGPLRPLHVHMGSASLSLAPSPSMGQASPERVGVSDRGQSGAGRPRRAHCRANHGAEPCAISRPPPNIPAPRLFVALKTFSPG